MAALNNMQSAKDRVYKTIKERIISLDLKPGDVLSDRKLSEELKKSGAAEAVKEVLNLQLPITKDERNLVILECLHNN